MSKAERLIREATGLHVLVYAGNGYGRPAELLFESGREDESRRICELLLTLLRERRVGEPTAAG